MSALNTILAGFLFIFSLTGLSSASEPSIQPLHYSLTLTGIQNPFEEISWDDQACKGAFRKNFP